MVTTELSKKRPSMTQRGFTPILRFALLLFFVAWSNHGDFVIIVHAFTIVTGVTGRGGGSTSHRSFGNQMNHPREETTPWRTRDPVQGLSSRDHFLRSNRITLDENDVDMGSKRGTEWRGMVQQKMQQAMALTNSHTTSDGNTDACQAWSDFFTLASSSQLALLYKDTPVVVILCLTLYGSTLSGTGNDRLAVHVFSQARTLFLDTHQNHNWELEYRIGMGRGLALQRLLRYAEARDEFCDLLSSSSSLWMEMKAFESNQPDVEQMIMGAVVCSMRLGDLLGAIQILEQFAQNVCDDKDDDRWMSQYKELSGLLGILLFLRSMNQDESSLSTHSNNIPLPSSEIKRIVSLLETASSVSLSENEGSVSPLYSWVLDHCVLDIKRKDAWNHMGNSSLAWAAINTGPFDDPGLLLLDDKVLLHRLLTTTKKEESSSSSQFVVENHVDNTVPVESFWPTSYILPEDVVHFQHHVTAVKTATPSKQQQATLFKPWILKERAGYGSHGNCLATTEDVIRYCDNENSSLSPNKEEALLCQTVIDPPLLIDGRKFSLRVYVIYFLDEKDDTSTGGCSTYLCNEGLVKLAALPYNSSSGNENDVQMTNSGRGRGVVSEKQTNEDDNMATQYDFHYLKKELEARGWDYETDLWNGIRSTVCTVMGRYQTTFRQEEDATTMTTCSVMRQKLARLGLPKILGLDFVLEEKEQLQGERRIIPWLLEVNRFPGLEPRGSSDSFVKQTVVVQDAWRCAAKRRLDNTGISNTLDIASLEYLPL